MCHAPSNLGPRYGIPFTWTTLSPHLPTITFVYVCNSYSSLRFHVSGYFTEVSLSSLNWTGFPVLMSHSTLFLLLITIVTASKYTFICMIINAFFTLEYNFHKRKDPVFAYNCIFSSWYVEGKQLNSPYQKINQTISGISILHGWFFYNLLVGGGC